MAYDGKNKDSFYKISTYNEMLEPSERIKRKEGLKEKYLSKNGGHFYGLKDEGKTMGILRKNISSSLNQYKRHITLS